MGIKCCKDCVPPKRHTACWDHCPEFAAEKAKDAELKKKENERRKISFSIYNQRTERVEKAMRRRRWKITKRY